MDEQGLFDHACNLGYKGDSDIDDIAEFLGQIKMNVVKFMGLYYVEPADECKD